MFYKKGALKSFAKFTRKHLCQSLFFNKDVGLRPEQRRVRTEQVLKDVENMENILQHLHFNPLFHNVEKWPNIL